MRRTAFLVVLIAIAALAGGHIAGQDATSSAERENTRKPWVRWWWPGSAVDRQNLTRQLEELARVGIGGVEITPIYGARGYEERYIRFLTPEFMAILWRGKIVEAGMRAELFESENQFVRQFLSGESAGPLGME